MTSRLPPTPVHRADAGERGATRDANGVAANADIAIERAANAPGAPLPEDLRERFESSLGVDLSPVRVHTDTASATAANAVGAHAFTIGHDIHFGAGKYDPCGAFGVHLLAHEVAHTVQQHGTTPTRQDKLEVSSARDDSEIEADRAADEMVAGRRAEVRSGRARVARVQELTDAANEGERAMDDVMRSTSVPVMNVTNVEDKGAASAILRLIESQDADVKQGMATKQVDPSVAVENQHCAALLNTYLESAEAQTIQIQTFQGLFGRAMKDFARLNEMSKTFDGMNLARMEDVAEADKHGGDITKAIFGSDDAKQELATVQGLDPAIKTRLDQMRVKKDGLTSKGAKVIEHSNDFAAAMSTLANRQRAFAAKSSTVKDPDAQRALLDAKERARHDYSAQAGAIVKDALISGVKAAQGGPAAAGAAAGKAAASGVWSTIVSPKINEALERADISVGKFPNNHAEADKMAADLAVWNELRLIAGQISTQGDVCRQKAAALGSEVELYEQERATYELEMIQLGQDMDKLTRQAQLSRRKPLSCEDICNPYKDPEPLPARKGPRFETAMQFLAEADQFIAQCEVAEKQGQEELKVQEASKRNAASRAHTALADVTPGHNASRPAAYFTISRMEVTEKDGRTWTKLTPLRHALHLHNGLNPSAPVDGRPDETHRFGSAEGGDGFGANQVIEGHLGKLSESRAKIAAMRSGLAGALGL